MPEMKPLLESLLLAADEPIGVDRLAELLELERPPVRQALAELMREYETAGRGIRLFEVAGGYQLRTPPEHAEWVRRLSSERPFRFSRAALETLAIVAYRQPLTRSDIEYLRGVDSGGVLKTLLDKHLVRILGKKDVPGKPIIYGTSPQFLELFGLKDLAGLPPLKEVDELARETAQPLTEQAAESGEGN